MSQNVAQWLAEIQSLQRQVSMLQQEREQAYNSVKSWRDLYEGEAKQRQRDAATHIRKLAQLEQTSQALKTQNEGSSDYSNQHPNSDGQSSSSIRDGAQDASARRLEADIAAIETTLSVEQLKQQLITTKRQCEQLKQQLKAEQDEHEQTRESLTAALGDAVNLLAKERG